MIRFGYPALVVDKARRICREVEAKATSQRERDRLCQERVGLTHRYLSRIGKVHRSPSNRVLLNLGFKLIVRDEDGAEEEVNLAKEAPCDWSIPNPRVRASSGESSEH